jgi:hypothetical protein
MRKLVAAVVVALIALAVAGLATATRETPKLYITSSSHTHPNPNPGYSYVCTRLKGPPNAKVTLDWGQTPLKSMTLTLGPTGRATVSFKITRAGRYGFVAHLVGTDEGDTDSYTVPPPPPDGPSRGPFRCPLPGVHRS